MKIIRGGALKTDNWSLKQMNFAVILSGGIGTRMQMGDFPKQYYKVRGKMILEYTLDKFQQAEQVDASVRSPS